MEKEKGTLELEVKSSKEWEEEAIKGERSFV